MSMSYSAVEILKATVSDESGAPDAVVPSSRPMYRANEWLQKLPHGTDRRFGEIVNMRDVLGIRKVVHRWYVEDTPHLREQSVLGAVCFPNRQGL
jgi:hypothetical protein